MSNSTKPKVTVDVTLTDTTEYDSRVNLEVGRFQRCAMWIGGPGYGSVAIVGTPELFRAFARVVDACADEAERAEVSEAGRDLDGSTGHEPRNATDGAASAVGGAR